MSRIIALPGASSLASSSPRTNIRSNAKDAACLLLLLGFALTVVSPVLAGGVPVAVDTLGLWGPQGRLGTLPVNNTALADSALQNLPWQVFIRRTLASGEWPLWDASLFSGYPFLGNSQSQLYYPVAWLLLLLPLPNALQVGVVLNIWLAGTGMYLLARLLRVSRAGSLLSGLAFAGSGQLYTALEFPNIASIYVWLPWVLAAAELAWRRRSWAWAASAGLLYGVLAAAGSPQWLVYSTLFLVLWLGARLVGAAWEMGRGSPGKWKVLAGQAARSSAILAWGPALAAVHLLPFVEMVGLSSRVGAAGFPVGADTFERALRLLERHLDVFVPRFYGSMVGNIGNPLTLNNCWYVGLVPLALASVALLLPRGRLVWFLGVVGVAAFAVAANVPLFNRLHQLPGLQSQVPGRAAYVFIFCVALLAGIGFDALVAMARRKPWVAGGVIGLLTVSGLAIASLLVGKHETYSGDPALYDLQAEAMSQALLVAVALLGWGVLLLLLRGDRWRSGRAALAALLIGLVGFDLLTYAPGYNTYVSQEALRFESEVADVMLADKGQWRMMAPDEPAPMFPPNSAALYGLHDVQGAESLHLARYEQFWAAADPALAEGGYFNVVFRPQSYSSAQADLLNVKYVTTWSPLSEDKIADKLEPVYEEEMAVYLNGAALPRAFVVARAEVMPADEIPHRISQRDFDPLGAVLLEQAPPPEFTSINGDTSPPGSVTITRYRNLSVEIEAVMQHPGWLVLGDVNYPGWHVEVDGRRAPLYTAYYILRAVPLDAGAHSVRFYFQPASVLLGGAISGAALLAALAVLTAAYVRRRKAGRQA